MKNNVVIIGKPNVGKSTLFNRLISKRIAITSNIPGTTRDRIIIECEWLSRKFDLVDTGGYRKNHHEPFQLEINEQIEIALKYANIILFTVSAQDLIDQDDEILANRLKRIKDKKLILVVNKVDNNKVATYANNFYKFGIKNTIFISSIHGIGISTLLDTIIKDIDYLESNESLEDEFRIGIIGKPNVGKSSLLNTILNSNRVITSNIPGTTRDSIDTKFILNNKNYVLVDTAGIKKNKSSLKDIEFFSEIRSNITIKNSDLIILVLDAFEGIEHIDKSLLSVIKEEQKPAIILLNKIDLVKKEKLDQYKEEIDYIFKFAKFYQVIYGSVLLKKNILSIFETIEKVRSNLNKWIDDKLLSEFLRELMIIKQPPRRRGKQIKIFSLHYSSKPIPIFTFITNDSIGLHFSYLRFVENQIRKVFNFEGVPIKILNNKQK